MSVKIKLLVSHLSIFLLVIVIGLIASFIILDNKQAEERHEMEMISRHSGELLLSSFEHKKLDLEQISTSHEIEKYIESYQELALAEFLARFVETFNEIVFVGFDGFEEVRVVDGRLAELLLEVNDDPFFKKSKEESGKFFVDFNGRATEGGAPVVKIYFGIKRYFGDEYVGTIVASSPTSKLKMFLQMMQMGKNGSSNLVDRDGFIIASTSEDLVSLRMCEESCPQKTLQQKIISNSHSFGRCEIFEIDSFFSSSPVADTGWSVVTVQPYASFVAEVDRLRNIYLSIMFSFSLVGGMLVYFMARRMTRPLMVLNDAAKSVATGHPRSIPALKRNDEIGQLVNSFNIMIHDLKTTTVSRDYLDRVIHSMTDSLLVIDENDKIEAINQACCNMLGYKKNEILHRPVDKVFIDSKPDDASWFDLLAFSSDNAAQECFYLKNNGDLVPVWRVTSVLYDNDDKATGIICVGHDLSQRKKTEEKLQRLNHKLQESNAELQEFAYVASHDLQEPLRKITAFGERLRTRYGDELGERGVDYLNRMENAAHRMQGLIAGLLAFSRVKTKAQPFARVDLAKVAEGVVSDLDMRIKDSNGRVEIGDLASIDADPLQMRQIMQNLIGNALKFSRDDAPPVVKVSGEEIDDGFYRISVADNGIGFDEKYTDRIFGVFQRLHGRGQYEGSGIGLAICRKIADRHGGDIAVSSEEGKGTTFIVTLPLHQENKQDEALAGEDDS